MKINEVERLVGVTKGNIRFYEKEGLLNPARNSENGYRDYDEADVACLKKIKFFRKLNVPLDEIRKMQSGVLTVSDAMERHVIQLERERANLLAMQGLCRQLLEQRPQLASLDADDYLSQMEKQEQEGTKFMNIKHQDTKIKYVAPVLVTLLMVLLMGALVAVLLWAFSFAPEGVLPLPLQIVLCAVPVAVIAGVAAALYSRIKQIRGGEEDAAAQY